MMDRRFPARPEWYDKKVGLVLQGGGALGSYQAGVYEALANSEYVPDWVAGISIGAVNAAIIAGNEPAERIARLRSFWEGITEPTAWWPTLNGPLGISQRQISALISLMFGQPGFFSPWRAKDWLAPGTRTSLCDTSLLRSTLGRLVDFDRINQRKEMRVSFGAVNVRTGRLLYFDNAHMTLRPEHVMASGALPPGFPPVEIDGEEYWDGGLVSNTPLEYVLDSSPRRSRLTFQVDLFQGYGPLPQDLIEVSEREKDIRYASRTRRNTDVFQQKHEVRFAINEMYELLPEHLRQTPQGKRLYELACVTEMDIAQLIYRPLVPQGAWKDFEFSRGTMNARWEQGLADASKTLRAAPWLESKPRQVGVRIFDVVHDMLVARRSKLSVGQAEEISVFSPGI